MKYRKNIRLKNYDYSTNGYYFVTICADYKKSFFNNSQIRKIVVAELALLVERFSGLIIDYSVIMPNHIHIIFIFDNLQFPCHKVIQTFKSLTTLKAKQALQLQNDQKLWQLNYYEHVIRNEKALSKIREYIENNPLVEKLDWTKLDA